MNKELSEIESIIKYLDGELTQKEIEKIEFKLFFNEAFRKKFLMIKEAENHLREIFGQKRNIQSIKMAFSESDEVKPCKFSESDLAFELEKEKIMSPLPNRWYHSFYKAAAIFIFIVLSTFIIKQIISFKAPKTSYIYDKYYTFYEIGFRNDDKVCYKTIALELYNNRDFDGARKLLYKAMPSDSSLSFYIALINLEKKQYELAIQNFQYSINKDEKQINYIIAKWYISLAWLRLNKPEKAIPYLKWLKNNDRFYGHKASLILKELSE